LVSEINFALLSAKYAGKSVDFGALPCGYMPLDWDTFVMDNSGTKKEDVCAGGRQNLRNSDHHTQESTTLELFSVSYLILCG